MSTCFGRELGPRRGFSRVDGGSRSNGLVSSVIVTGERAREGSNQLSDGQVGKGRCLSLLCDCLAAERYGWNSREYLEMNSPEVTSRCKLSQLLLCVNDGATEHWTSRVLPCEILTRLSR